MVTKITDRIECLYRDVMRMPKGNLRPIFDDFTRDIESILTGISINDIPIEDKLMSLFKTCCMAFGVKPIDVLQAKRSTVSSNYAITAFVKLSIDKYNNKDATMRLIARSRPYYYKAMEKFDELMNWDKTFTDIYNTIRHETGDTEAD